MENKIKFIANAVRWFDRVNGNTYHSVNITRVKDGKVIYCPMTYGYGECYRQTALELMHQYNWLPTRYINDSRDLPEGYAPLFMYERENNYPIYWNVTDGLKRDCVKNGKE
jgi:hypothetical protein